MRLTTRPWRTAIRACLASCFRSAPVRRALPALLPVHLPLLSQQQAAEAPATPAAFQTRPAVTALNGIVSSGHPVSSAAGLRILMQGGNAFDAAVAVGAAAAMAEPEMNGIGGNGFMTVYHKATGRVWSLSMTGAAPRALNPAEMTPATLNAGMRGGSSPGTWGATWPSCSASARCR